MEQLKLDFDPIPTLAEVQDLALDLMWQHGLTPKWRFRFDNARERYGCCHYPLRTITISPHLATLNPISQTRDTILHEIAHALVGPGHGHDRRWKAKAVAIGCNGKRCYDNGSVKQPPPKYLATCPNCQKQSYGHRRAQVACGVCCKAHSGGKYTSRFLLQWRKVEP